MNIITPSPISFVLSELSNKGYKAYIVGGCVRDSILGKTPKDWDITTSAIPDEVIAVFKGYPVIPTGLKHGTVTVVIGNMQIEITTFRIDGEYSDNRHCNDVKFVTDLELDLSRRDFTINAMAYNHEEGLIDLFGGQEDLRNSTIRCVGDADKRFQEDGLRMLRAIRFASRFDFLIDLDTAVAIRDNCHLINNISAERINSELSQIIVNKPHMLEVMEYLGLMQHIIPEFSECLKCEQNNPYHVYDVGVHTIKAMEAIENDLALRLTVFLHDIAKPLCVTTDVHGVHHFFGHNQMGADMAVEILRRLRYENHIVMKVRDLVMYHDAGIHDNVKSIKRWLNRIGEERLRELLLVKRADTSGQCPDHFQERMDMIGRVEEVLNQVIEQKECFSKKDLAINGNDIIEAGYPKGKVIGFIIDALVEKVIENPEDNTREKLLEIIPTIRGFRRLMGIIEEGEV